MFSKISRGKWFARLIVLGIVLALALLAGVTVLTNLAYQRAVADLVMERDKQVTFLSAFRMQAELSKFSQTLQNLSRTKEIQSQDPAAQRQALQQANFRLADFDGGVLLLDTFGRVVVAEPERPDITNKDWSNRDYFRQLIGGSTVAFSNTVADGPGGVSVVAVSVPILNEDGQFTGALVGMFRLGQRTVSSFYASIVRLRLSQGGSTYVVDADGNILFDSASNLVGQHYSSEVPGLALAETSGVVRTTNNDRHDVVASYAAVPGTPWTLITEDNWALLTAPVQNYINLLLSLMILGIALSSVGLGLLLHLRNQEVFRRSQTENEMAVARQLKQKLLPRQVPVLPGWKLTIHHQPADAVSGDFYDFMYLPDGRFMLVMGEVADSGIVAAMKMTTLRAAFRGAGQRLLSPAKALEYSNALISPDLPPEKSIRCLFGIFDSASGSLEFASAGQNRAYHCNGDHTSELEMTGDPLGLSLESRYNQNLTKINAGERFLLCSDGVVQVCGPKGEPFGSQRLLAALSNQHDEGKTLIERLVEELRDFSGKKWQPEHDVTLLLLEPDPAKVG